jgi:dolichol-phosphate mannosyltransferase
MKLSIIIAAYNEKGTILECVKRVESVALPFGAAKEIILVDDGSTDGTGALIDSLANRHIALHHEKNLGKGSAIRTGLAKATGEYVVTQDADLENDPNDLARMLSVMIERNLEVLYGSRRLKEDNKQHAHASYYAGGVFLSMLASVLYGQRITDEPTCYKMFRTELLKSLPLTCKGFEYCPEVTALVSKRGIKIEEVPISYHPRSVQEGKKIKWRDGIEAAFVLIRYKIGL